MNQREGEKLVAIIISGRVDAVKSENPNQHPGDIAAHQRLGSGQQK